MITEVTEGLCEMPQCGYPQLGPGHPKKGWVFAKQAGHAHRDVWFCSWDCASRAATRMALAGADSHLVDQ